MSCNLLQGCDVAFPNPGKSVARGKYICKTSQTGYTGTCGKEGQVTLQPNGASMNVYVPGSGKDKSGGSGSGSGGNAFNQAASSSGGKGATTQPKKPTPTLSKSGSSIKKSVSSPSKPASSPNKPASSPQAPSKPISTVKPKITNKGTSGGLDPSES